MEREEEWVRGGRRERGTGWKERRKEGEVEGGRGGWAKRRMEGEEEEGRGRRRERRTEGEEG